MCSPIASLLETDRDMKVGHHNLGITARQAGIKGLQSACTAQYGSFMYIGMAMGGPTL